MYNKVILATVSIAMLASSGGAEQQGSASGHVERGFGRFLCLSGSDHPDEPGFCAVLP